MIQAKCNRSTQRRPLQVSLVLLLTISLLFTSTASLFAQSTVHVVQPGDSLSAIAVRYGVSMSELAGMNGISDSNDILIGQQLTIPGAAGSDDTGWATTATVDAGAVGTVTVGRGDSLSLIAVMHGMTVQELMALNGLTDPNHVWVGQQLQVYGGTASDTSVASSTAPAAPEPGSESDLIYHVVQPGDSLSSIAAYHGVSQQSVMDVNGIYNPNHVRLGQRLAIVGGARPSANDVYAAPAGQKRIVVDLSDQTLTAWHGETVVLYTSISSGTWATPTITGWFKIDRKYPRQHMSGPGYSIPDVPNVMYFWDGYAFHGAYWHNNFGVPMSHGCVHVRPGEDQWLYNWADVGTDVFVTW